MWWLWHFESGARAGPLAGRTGLHAPRAQAFPGVCYPSRGVLKALLIAAILCVSFQMSGLAAIFGDPGCSDECPADASGGECAPNCAFCACCSVPRALKPQCTLMPIAQGQHRLWFAPRFDVPAQPDPADILHVPRLNLA